MATPKEQMGPKIGGKPIFAGKTALIRFVNGGDSDMQNTSIWLAERDTKTIRPFVSEEFFDTMFDNPVQAQKAIVTLPSDELGPDGIFKDFKVLGDDFAANPGEDLAKVPFSPALTQKRYGKPADPEGENRTAQAIDGMLARVLGRGDAGQPTSPDGVPQDRSEMSPESTIPPVPPSPQGAMGTGSPDGKGDVGSGTVRWYDGKGGLFEDLTKGGYAFSPQDIEKRTPQVVAAMQKLGLSDYAPTTGTSTTGGTLHMYGTAVKDRDTAAENQMETNIRNMLQAAEIMPGDEGQDAPDFWFEKIATDKDMMGFYVGAGQYGGYSLPDIYADMVRTYKAQSDPSLRNKLIIDPEITKDSFLATADGQLASTIKNTVVPASSYMNMGIDYDQFENYDVGHMPMDVFNSLVPVPDITDPSYKDQVNSQVTAFEDSAIEIAKATTDTEYRQAAYNYDIAKKALEDTYGIQLSDNADKAWTQVQQLMNDMSSRGLSGSGMEDEAVANAMRAAQKRSAQIDKTKMSAEEQKDFTYYTTSASSDQIQKLLQDDLSKGIPKEQTRAYQWGLVPSDEEAAYFSLDSIKARNPGISEEDAQALRDSAVDKNGNIRSTVYKTLYDKLNTPKTGLVDVATKAKQDKLLGNIETERTKQLEKGGVQASNDYGGKPYTPEKGVTLPTDQPAQTSGLTPENPAGNPPVEETPTGKTPAATYGTIPTNSVLQYGTTSEDVKKLQTFLKNHGYDDILTAGATGYFGDQTRAALTQFQKDAGIDTSGNYGYYGPLTQKWISSNPDFVRKETQANTNTTNVAKVTVPTTTGSTQNIGLGGQPVTTSSLFGGSNTSAPVSVPAPVTAPKVTPTPVTAPKVTPVTTPSTPTPTSSATTVAAQQKQLADMLKTLQGMQSSLPK